MNNFKTEIVTAQELAPGDLVERLGLTGLGWFVVTLVEWVLVDDFPGKAVRVEFAGATATRYLPASTFKRRVEEAPACTRCAGIGAEVGCVECAPADLNGERRRCPTCGGECVRCAGQDLVVEDAR